jgi:indole-3-glycerol phosphate synthase
MSWLAEVCREESSAAAARGRERPLAALLDEARDLPPPRDFVGALRRQMPRRAALPSVIAEIKFASPTQGPIRAGRDVEAIAAGYARAGAAALSVLVDRVWFAGDPAFVARARAASGLPVLAKGFFVDPYQVAEARLAGADAVLLIARCFSAAQLAEMHAAAGALGLTALVELHDASDLARTARLPLAAVGVNNRDLDTLAVNRDAYLGLAPLLPRGPARVAESGFRSRRELAWAAAVGYDAALIGTSLMRRSDPGAALAELLDGASDDAARPIEPARPAGSAAAPER